MSTTSEAALPNWVKLNLSQLTSLKKMHETTGDLAIGPIFNTLKPEDKLLIKRKLVLMSELVNVMRQLHENNVA